MAGRRRQRQCRSTFCGSRREEELTRGISDVHLCLAQVQSCKARAACESAFDGLSVHETAKDPRGFLPRIPELAIRGVQLPAVANAGFRAIAPTQTPDMRIRRACVRRCLRPYRVDRRLVGLLDALKIEPRDFRRSRIGRFVAWAMPVLYPERTAGVIRRLPRPYMRCRKLLHAQLVNSKDERMYILWFQEPPCRERDGSQGALDF